MTQRRARAWDQRPGTLVNPSSSLQVARKRLFVLIGRAFGKNLRDPPGRALARLCVVLSVLYCAFIGTYVGSVVDSAAENGDTEGAGCPSGCAAKTNVPTGSIPVVH